MAFSFKDSSMSEFSPADGLGHDRFDDMPFVLDHDLPDHMIQQSSELHYSYFGGQVRVLAACPVSGTEVDISLPEVYYAHGAGWGQEQPTVEQIARFGRRAFAMEFTGGRRPDARFVIGRTVLGEVTSLQHVADRQIGRFLGQVDMIVPQQQIREAATLLAVLADRQEGDTAPVDAIFQSESAGHGLVAAYTRPEAFRNIVLAFPGSLSGPQTGFIPGKVARDALIRRAYRPTQANDFRPPRELSPHKALRLQLKSPGFREDAFALRYSALAPMLHAIRQREHAPNITLVAGLDDRIFELKDYFESLIDTSDLDNIVVVPGGHAIGGRKDVLLTIMNQLSHKNAMRREMLRELPLRNRLILPNGLPTARKELLLSLADMVGRQGRDNDREM